MNIKEKMQYGLAAIIVIGFVGITIFMMWPTAKEALPEWLSKNLNMVFIAWVTQFATVINYFFGSSKGSSDKNDLLRPK